MGKVKDVGAYIVYDEVAKMGTVQWEHLVDTLRANGFRWLRADWSNREAQPPLNPDTTVGVLLP